MADQVSDCHWEIIEKTYTREFSGKINTPSVDIDIDGKNNYEIQGPEIQTPEINIPEIDPISIKPD